MDFVDLNKMENDQDPRGILTAKMQKVDKFVVLNAAALSIICLR